MESRIAKLAKMRLEYFSEQIYCNGKSKNRKLEAASDKLLIDT